MCGIFIYLTTFSYHSLWQRPHINVYGFDADLAVGWSVSRGFQVFPGYSTVNSAPYYRLGASLQQSYRGEGEQTARACSYAWIPL